MKFPIKTVSESNMREHWVVKNSRRNAQQKAFQIHWRNAKPSFNLPARIIFTRYSCNVLDSDNLAGSMKHVRDQLAKEIKIDDGSELLKFEYRQEKINKREHYFTVEITEI